MAQTSYLRIILKKITIHIHQHQKCRLCTGVNMAARKSTTDYIVYAHDDMYFLPKWDLYLSVKSHYKT